MDMVFKMPYQEHRFSFLENDPIGWKFAQRQTILNDNWIVNLFNEHRTLPQDASKTMRFQRYKVLDG